MPHYYRIRLKADPSLVLGQALVNHAGGRIPAC